MSFEEEFDIDIPDHAVANLVTGGDAIAFIIAKAV
jgi:acyl carrier protein